MGFKAWRNLGVMALAGASLVGCTNGTDKDKNFKTPANVPTWNTPPNQTIPPPNGAVFNTPQQQQQPQMQTLPNQGFLQRSNLPSPTQQNGMPSTNSGFNNSPQSSTGGSYQSPSIQGMQIPSNPANSSVNFTTPTPGSNQPAFPQQSTNPGTQPNFGSAANQSGYNQIGGAPAIPQLPTPPALPGGSFTPLPAPADFGTHRQ